MARKWRKGDAITKEVVEKLRERGVEEGTLITAELLNDLKINAPDNHGDNPEPKKGDISYGVYKNSVEYRRHYY